MNNEQTSYFKRALVLLMAVVMVFTYMPSMAWAANDNDTVHVIVENTTFTEATDGNTPAWTGTLVNTDVTLTEDATMMSCIIKALETVGYTAEGANTGYISKITKGEQSLGEKDGGTESGWMGTLNDWFTNEGFANYTVANGKLKAGDEITMQYTCNLGADIGGSFDSSDKSLKTITLSEGELTPTFSSDVHDYTMILPTNVTELTVTPTANNRQNRVRIYAGSKEYGRKDTIPVQVGTVITLKVGNDGDTAPEIYTITLHRAGTLLSGDNVSLISIKQDGYQGSEVTLTFDEESATFSGTLANYTHLKQYNDGGFTITLKELPSDATALPLCV